jgi:hypothetical protein
LLGTVSKYFPNVTKTKESTSIYLVVTTNAAESVKYSSTILRGPRSSQCRIHDTSMYCRKGGGRARKETRYYFIYLGNSCHNEKRRAQCFVSVDTCVGKQLIRTDRLVIKSHTYQPTNSMALSPSCESASCSKYFLTFYETRRFSTVFTRALRCSLS